MAKRTVVFDANPLVGQKTGIGQLTYQLIISLANDNPEVDFIGHYFDFLGRKNPQDLPITKNISYKKTTLFPTKLVSILRKLKIRLPIEVFTRVKASTLIFPNFVGVPSIFTKQKILFVHDLCYEDFPQYVSEKNGAFLRKWVPISIKSASKVVAISNFTKKRIENVYGVISDKIITIPVPPQKLPEPDYRIIELLNLDKFILFIGTIEPRKNILNLINSYSLLSESIRSEYSLVLAGGKGWKDKTILEQIEFLKKEGYKIITTGYISNKEKSALYQRSSAVVQVSHYEGFGMPVLEAMSYGKPVICSDIEVFREIADRNALFVDKDNPRKISEAIEEILIDKQLSKNLSEKSNNYASKYPTWNQVAQSLKKELL